MSSSRTLSEQKIEALKISDMMSENYPPTNIAVLTETARFIYLHQPQFERPWHRICQLLDWALYLANKSRLIQEKEDK